MDSVITKVIEIIQPNLITGESIVAISLAEPLPMSRADYFTRYKIKIGRIDGSGSSVSNIRCLIIQFSSNRQSASIDYINNCDSIGDVKF